MSTLLVAVLLVQSLLVSVTCLGRGPLGKTVYYASRRQASSGISRNTKVALLPSDDGDGKVKIVLAITTVTTTTPLFVHLTKNDEWVRVKSLMVLAAVGFGSLVLAPDADAASSLLANGGGVSASLVSHWKYFLCGAAACTISHGVTVPFDVVKTRIQIGSAEDNPSQAKTDTSAPAPDYLPLFRQIIEDKGVKFLFQGMGPTLVGYAVHGFFKYGLYESFKPVIGPALAQGLDTSSPFALTLLTYILSGLFAEVIASYFLCPFEASRIRLVASPQFAGYGLISTMRTIYTDEGAASLYRGLPALFFKHIPYTVTQLSSFEVLRGAIFNALSVDNPEDYRFAVTTVSALFAAFLASLASQPGDTLLSIINKKSRAATGGAAALSSANPLVLIPEVGLRGLFVGTQARLVHVSIIVVVQLVVYDYVKVLFGLAAGH